MASNTATGHEILIERTFDADPVLVWQAWTQPSLIRQWFGSDPGGTVEEVVMDVRPGGKYSITFRDSDQTQHTCSGVFSTVIAGKQLVYSWEWKSEPGHISYVDVRFQATGEKTTIILRHGNLHSQSQHSYHEGWNRSLDKMGKTIFHINDQNMDNKKTAYTKTAANKLHVTRVFDAPSQLVWKTWTDRELLDQWWAPRPYRAKTKSLDFKNGGSWLYAMEGPEGDRQWCKVDFSNIVADKNFSGTVFFCDENGVKNTEWPVMNWNNVFIPAGGQTKVEVDITFDSEADLEKIVNLGFQQGFEAAHGNLDELLASMPGKA